MRLLCLGDHYFPTAYRNIAPCFCFFNLWPDVFLFEQTSQAAICKFKDQVATLMHCWLRCSEAVPLAEECVPEQKQSGDERRFSWD